MRSRRRKGIVRMRKTQKKSNALKCQKGKGGSENEKNGVDQIGKKRTGREAFTRQWSVIGGSEVSPHSCRVRI